MNHRLFVFALLIFVVIASPAWALYCSSCGTKAADDARFCGQCGKPFPGTETVPSLSAVSPLVFTKSVGSGSTLVAPPSPQAFQVTSYYLLLNGDRVSRNSLFWIAEISGDRARIWCMDEPPMYGFIMGWVNLSELEKRTTWKSDAATYCVEPPPPSAEIVVVHDRTYWRHWKPRSYIYSWPHRHNSWKHHGKHH